jgi:hypothetical protein
LTLCKNEQGEDMLEWLNSQPFRQSFRFFYAKIVEKVALAVYCSTALPRNKAETCK